MPSRFIRSKRVSTDPDDLAHHLAYNARCAVKFGEQGKLFDYGKETDWHAGGLIHPDPVARLQRDRSGIWEAFLTHAHPKQETVAFSLIATLPREGELIAEERIALIAGFCEPIRQAGHVIDWQLHRGSDANWHVHLIISVRGLRPDATTEALSGSPFYVTARIDKGSAEEDERKLTVLNPPWQRLWRVTQDRFFTRRAIPLRVPASTYQVSADSDRKDGRLEPASQRGGYAPPEKVDTWRKTRRERFSQPDHYLAALTRDRLIIDQHDINAFNNMVFGDQPLPAAIAGIFADPRSVHAGPSDDAGAYRGIRFANNTFTSVEAGALLCRAIRTTRVLDYTEFDDGSSAPDDVVFGFANIVWGDSIAMVSARERGHLLPIDANALKPHGLLVFLDALPRYIKPLFITPDHLSYRHHGAALTARGWAVKGISEILKPEFVRILDEDKGYQDCDVMLIMLDAQRLTDRWLASLICVADKLRRARGRLRLLLLKPDDVAAEPIAPLMAWLSRNLRHFFISAPNGKDTKPLARADEINTFSQRFPGQCRSSFESTIRFDDLPPQLIKRDGRRAQRAAILRFLRKKRYLPRNPARRHHPLILVGPPDHDARPASGRASSSGAPPPSHKPGAIRAFQLSRRGKAMITAETVISSPGQHDRSFGTGTVVTIVDVDIKKGVFWFEDPKTGDPLSAPITTARDFLPLDFVSARDAFLIADHFDKLVEQLDVHVYVFVTDREHAEQLIALAHRFDQRLLKVVVDKQLCASTKELLDLIDRNPLLDTIGALARIIDSEPRIQQMMRQHPRVIELARIDDEMIAEAEAHRCGAREQQGSEAQPDEPQSAGIEDKKDFELDPFPKPDGAAKRARITETNAAPDRRPASWQSTDDGDYEDHGDYEDDFGDEKILRDSFANERDDPSVFDDRDNDTDTPIPGFWRGSIDPDPDDK